MNEFTLPFGTIIVVALLAGPEQSKRSFVITVMVLSDILNHLLQNVFFLQQSPVHPYLDPFSASRILCRITSAVRGHENRVKVTHLWALYNVVAGKLLFCPVPEANILSLEGQVQFLLAHSCVWVCGCVPFKNVRNIFSSWPILCSVAS